MQLCLTHFFCFYGLQITTAMVKSNLVPEKELVNGNPDPPPPKCQCFKSMLVGLFHANTSSILDEQYNSLVSNVVGAMLHLYGLNDYSVMDRTWSMPLSCPILSMFVSSYSTPLTPLGFFIEDEVHNLSSSL
jgi:hypothetical protein